MDMDDNDNDDDDDYEHHLQNDSVGPPNLPSEMCPGAVRSCKCSYTDVS